ncbi:MAG: hypothetical protein Q8P88_00480 [Candidatus Jorgensenbacteria bacterium]|nr:hypothetical protein [Candidatus Jorgensenbacteria bacterium]
MEQLKLPKTIVRAALLIIGGGLLAYFISASVVAFRLPEEFVRARQSAAAVSQHIVDLTALTGKKLTEVNLSDLEGETARALALLGDARQANEAAYGKAFELTERLQELARSLAEVSSVTKQREGSEAIAIELSLVSEFIIYTQKVDTFLDLLERAVRTNLASDRAATAAALDEVNEKVVSINALNRAFREAIGEFDAPEAEK